MHLQLPLIQLSKILVISLLLSSCKNQQTFETLARQQPRNLSDEFKDYWYSGKAEITSYELIQPRYGQLREGKAVLIFVTEDFLPKKQVKADHSRPENIPVLKLNTTKNFVTGIYPYSIMTSAFLPLARKAHAIKVTNSTQEWCGQMYTQLNYRGEYYVESHSYFEGEADQNFTLPRGTTEDEIWSLLRVNPLELPQGSKKIIPSVEYLRLHHKPIKPYQASCELQEGLYTIKYPGLQRSLSIYFEPKFPHQILSWTETFPSRGVEMTSTATRIKSIKTAYWEQNDSRFMVLRDSLGL